MQTPGLATLLVGMSGRRAKRTLPCKQANSPSDPSRTSARVGEDGILASMKHSFEPLRCCQLGVGRKLDRRELARVKGHIMQRTVMALIFTIGLSAAGLAAELQQKTIAFLLEIGFDPKSPMIMQIVGDKVGNTTLDSLAGDRDRSEVRRFIITRNFIRQFKVNPDLPFPSPLDYNDEYFTSEEVDFFLAKDTERRKRRCAAEKIPSGKIPSGTFLPCP